MNEAEYEKKNKILDKNVRTTDIVNLMKNDILDVSIDEVNDISEISEISENKSETTTLLDTFSNIISSITKLKSEFVIIQNNIRCLEKQTKKHIKTLEKELIKRRPKNKKKPSGFAQPVDISRELCEFLEKPNGTQMARTEVTQYIINYIKCHKLQNEENKKIIKPDNKLLSLLDIENNAELTYFNLQSYMNRHFIKE
jgi:chromatin remodeling complex protein RSC6